MANDSTLAISASKLSKILEIPVITVSKKGKVVRVADASTVVSLASEVVGDINLSFMGAGGLFLDNLEKVTGSLRLSGVSVPIVLNRLHTVTENLVLSRCSKLTTLASFEKLRSVGDTLDLTDCSSLKDLGKIEEVGELFTHGCSSLKSLGNLEIVRGTIWADKTQVEIIAEAKSKNFKIRVS